MGTIIHAVYEVFALHKKAQQDNQKTIKHEVFGEIAAVDPMSIDPQELYDQCWEYYTAKSHHEFTEKEKKEYFGHMCVIFGTPEDPRTQHIISTEEYIQFEIKEPWAKYQYFSEKKQKVISGYYKINAIVDLVVQEDEDTIKFQDFKTGARKCWITGKKKEYSDLYNDIQLNIYYHILKDRYPDKTVKICIYYNKDGGAFEFIFNKENRKETLKKLKNRIEEISSMIVPKKNRSYRCKWCFFSKVKLKDAPKERRRGQLDHVGEKMCLCSDIHERIKKDGINNVIRNFKKEDLETDGH